MTTTAMLDKTADHPEIWLEPKSDDYDSEGRMWCQDNQWGTEGVRYVRADTHAAGDVTGLVERLERRAKTMNGAQPVGAGDGNTYTVGYYSLGDNKLDTEAAASLLATSARDEAAEVRVKELEAELAEWQEAAGHYYDVTTDYFSDTAFDANGALAKADAELYVLLDGVRRAARSTLAKEVGRG